jgi:hypothetical protein
MNDINDDGRLSNEEYFKKVATELNWNSGYINNAVKPSAEFLAMQQAKQHQIGLTISSLKTEYETLERKWTGNLKIAQKRSIQFSIRPKKNLVEEEEDEIKEFEERLKKEEKEQRYQDFKNAKIQKNIPLVVATPI